MGGLGKSRKADIRKSVMSLLMPTSRTWREKTGLLIIGISSEFSLIYKDHVCQPHLDSKMRWVLPTHAIKVVKHRSAPSLRLILLFNNHPLKFLLAFLLFVGHHFLNGFGTN